MYLIDKEHILNLLSYMEDRQASYNEIFELQGIVGELARERYIELMGTLVIDVGHLLIDGFLMRDAGSYEDILCILVDEEVIPKEAKSSLIRLVSLRSEFVRSYTELNNGNVVEVARETYEALAQFPRHIRNYLNEEVSVAHAFGKKE